MGRGLTASPLGLNQFWRRAEDFNSSLLGQNLAPGNPLRPAVNTYLQLAGIESGYGFFAPNVNGNCKLVFELQYADDRVEYTVPAVSSEASGLRVAALLDKIGRPQYEPLRDIMVRMLTQSVWRDHREATMIRAVFGSVTLPTIAEYERGGRESNQFLYAYDFEFTDDQPKKTTAP
jgi:hypothetical protein